MRILLVTPISSDIATGNRCSAEQWRDLLADLGHDVAIAGIYGSEEADLLLALNATKSAPSVEAFRRERPSAPVVVVLTGTDIYPQPDARALASMAAANFLVTLQAKAASQVPEALQDKVRVLVQAVHPLEAVAPPSATGFVVAVVGNLRAVKDPLLAARAARLVPPSSQLCVRHAGAVLDPGYQVLIAREQAENPRYRWLGPLAPAAARGLIAGSALLVVSSLSEGAGRVVGEAIVAGTPVLSTRIDGVTGLVGDDYPGLYPVGDARALADLLIRAETDPTFHADLRARCRTLAPAFAPARERAAWQRLLSELTR